MSLVIMSKKVEVNSPYFMPIHAAQNNISESDGALILSLPTPAGVVLRSGTVAVCNLHLLYTHRYLNLSHCLFTTFSYTECIHLFFSSEPPKELEGNIFYNSRLADW